jgi:hypothetical protein
MKNTAEFLVAFMIATVSLSLTSCSGKSSTGPSESTGSDFKTGSASVYTVTGTGAVSVRDSVSGASFAVTPGTGTKLTVAPITGGPEAPLEGTRFHVEYTGDQTVTVRVPADTADEEVALLSYGALEGAAIDDMAGNTGWWGVPPVSTGDGYLEYTVELGATGAAKAAAAKAPDANNFAITRVKSGTADFDHMRSIYQTVNQVIDQWISYLPADARAAARAKITALPWTVMWSSGGNSYKHVTSIFSPKVILFFNPQAQLLSIAHETGHYICNALMGTDRYSALYDRFPTDFWGSAVEHEPGSYRAGRKEILEDYPYVTMYMITGEVDGYDFTSVNKVNNFRDVTTSADPAKVDYPSHEGFGAAMALSLIRTADTVYSFTNMKGFETAKAPVVGAPWGDVLTILGRGPLDVNELRGFIQDYLDSRGNSYRFKLPAMMEPLGWSYNGSGKVVDKTGKPVKGAHVRSVSQDGTNEYRTPMSIATGDSGTFSLPRIYPGTNLLRISWNGDRDSTDVSFTADWNKPTNETLKMGTFTIDTSPAPKTTVITLTSNPTRIAWGGATAEPYDVAADITMISTYTITGPGLEVTKVGNYYQIPLNVPVSISVTASFSKNTIHDTNPYGAIFTVGDPVFVPKAYDSVSHYGSTQVTDRRTTTTMAFDFMFTSSGDSFNLAPRGQVPFEVGGMENNLYVVYTSQTYYIYGMGMSFLPKQ